MWFIVKVFPLPVYPYAITVIIPPFTIKSIIGFNVYLYTSSDYSSTLKVLSKVKSAFSIYFVIPSTLNLGAWTLIEGLAQLTASISPAFSSFWKIGLFLTQTQSFTSVTGVWWEKNLC